MSDKNDTTCDKPVDEYSIDQLVVSGIISPLIVAFGIITNTLNILVFAQKALLTSKINWYLLILSSSDLTALLCSPFIITLPMLSEKSGIGSFQSGVSQIAFIAYPLGMIAQTLSVYITICVSAHRFLGVCYPFQARRWCTHQNVKWLLVLVFLFSCLFNISRFFEINLQYQNEPNRNETIILFSASELRLNPHYIMFYNGVLYTLLMLILPFILLIVMNVQVIRTVQRSRSGELERVADSHINKRRAVPFEIRESRKSLIQSPSNGQKFSVGSTSSNEQNSSSRQQSISVSQNQTVGSKERSTTFMLIGVAFGFLAFNSLALVSNLIEIMFNTSEEIRNRLKCSLAYSITVAVSNLLILLNMTINLFIYASFSKPFRTVLGGCLRCRLRAANASILHVTAGYSTSSARKISQPLSDHSRTIRKESCESKEPMLKKDEASSMVGANSAASANGSLHT